MSTYDDDEALADEYARIADEIEAIDAYVKALLTPEEIERRMRATLEACGYAMPEETDEAGAHVTNAPASDLFRPSSAERHLPRTCCHATRRPSGRRRDTRGAGTDPAEQA